MPLFKKKKKKYSERNFKSQDIILSSSLNYQKSSYFLFLNAKIKHQP